MPLSQMPLGFGTTTNWIEFPLTGCTGSTINPNTSSSWACPTLGAANPGYLFNTSASVWNASSVEQVNGERPPGGALGPRPPSDTGLPAAR